MTVIGPTLTPYVSIDELTTVAAGYSMAQFIHDGVIMGPADALRIAAGMNENLVSPITGESSPVLASPPNGDQSNSLRSTRALANILAAYVRTWGIGVEYFYALATPPGGSAPNSFLQALSNIARDPSQNVEPLYVLAGIVPAYLPTLEQMPDAWTVVVKVNDTGSDRFLFAGPGNIDFDERGYAWISNNVRQGTPSSGRFAAVLKPNGRPADGLYGTPRSPLLGGGLLGGGYGVVVDPRGAVWFGNFGWGLPIFFPTPDGNGSLSLFDLAGRPLSGPRGIQGGPVRAQGVTLDRQGNLWIASFGNDRVYVFRNGNPNRSIYYQAAAGAGPFDVEIAEDGTAFVTNSGGLGPFGAGSFVHLALRGNELVPLFDLDFGHSNKGVGLDTSGNAWIASGGDDAVYMVTPDGTIAGKYDGGGIESPWGIAIDGDDNVWVANFGTMAPGADYDHAGITKLAGGPEANRPPGFETGEPISPPTGYTLPSAGEQVTLHDGTPLYGPNGPPSYSPLMRMTALTIDRAGNIWATNNWKPVFNLDASPINGNPGGDGICIFVGLATPPSRTP